MIIPQQTGDEEFQRRQQINDNQLYVNQLIGNYKFSERLNVDAKLAANFVRGNEPDRRTNKYLLRGGFYSPQTNSAGENERYFASLDENDFAANTKISYKLNKRKKTSLL